MSAEKIHPRDPSAPLPKGGEATDQNQVEALTSPPPIPRTRYELRILQALRRIIQNIEIHSHRLAQNHQITGPQLACLLAVVEDDPLTVTALARRVYLSPSTIVGIVDRLEEKGLLARNRSASDRRQVLVAATGAGRKLAEEAPALLQHTLAERFQALPELEQVSITLALEKVVDMMEARKIEAAPILAIGPIPEARPEQSPGADQS